MNKYFTRITSFILCLALAFSVCVASFSIDTSAVTFTPNFTITSEAAVMINLDKDTIVYSKNADKKMYPASLTKIMTALIVLDNVTDLEGTYYECPLVVFDELYGQNASAVGLSRGEIVSVEDLLYSMLLKSACESAGTLAYWVGGESISNFVDMMNAKATEIGCTGTHFVNPHGLYDDEQYTNAYDMALIAQYAVENYPKFVEIACTTSYSMSATNYHDEGWADITHTNLMLSTSSGYYYQYAKGIKTGTLDESGRNLCTLGSKDGNNYLLVTLGAPLYDDDGYTTYSVYSDHENLYEWAFENLEYKQILSSGKEVSELQVKFGQGTDYVRLVTASDYSMLWNTTVDTTRLKEVVEIYTDSLNEDGTITAPVEAGQIFGTYSLTLSGEVVCTVDLVAQNDVEVSMLSYQLAKAKNFLTSGWFTLAIAIFVVLIILYIILCIALRKKRRKKRRKVAKKRKF